MIQRKQKVFALFTCMITIMLIVPAASALTSWSKTYTGEPMDYMNPTSIIQTSDGGLAIVVYNNARRVDNVGYQGHFTQFDELEIIKTNSNGDVQWRKNFTQIDDPNGLNTPLRPIPTTYIIVQTADNGYVIASNGYNAFWMFKIDAQAKVLWTQTYIYDNENPTYSVLNAMIQTVDGGFALAGSTQTPEGGNDFWLVKADSNGKMQWNQAYNSGTYKDSTGIENRREDEAKSLVQTRDGGYALVGSASLFRASTSSVVYASWMIKLDQQGKRIWDKGYDSPNDQGRPFTIVQTLDGGYAVTGTQNNDFYIMKIDSTSQLQWSKIYGDKGTDVPCSLVQLEDGGYSLAGDWTKINSTATVATLGLLRLDSTGQMVWVKTYKAKENATTASLDQANAMIRTSDGSYIIAGSTMLSNEYHRDIFLVRTETLEQPFQPTPTSTQSTASPIVTSTPTSTSTSPSSPAQSSSAQSPIPSQSQGPTQSDSPSQTPNETPSPSIPELSPSMLLAVCVATALTVAFSRALNQKFGSRS